MKQFLKDWLTWAGCCLVLGMIAAALFVAWIHSTEQ